MLCAATALAACGGSNGSGAQPVGIAVSPVSASVQAGSGTLVLTATVTNAADTSVTWQVNGVAGGNAAVGTISTAGVYQAPASVPSPATVTVEATSVADPTQSASAVLTITAPPAVSVTVMPSAATVTVGGTQTFAATVANAADTAVNWQVNGVAGGNATVGTISADGTYVAPATVPASATVTVTAVSVADATKSGSATVTITAAPVISVAVSPASATVLTAATRTFTATVSNATNAAVTWQVNGVAGGNATVGTISAAGIYTAPASVASTTTVTVTAVSVADTTKSGSATVTVPAVSVAVAPTSASVPAAATQQFTATVSNATNTAVTWQVNGAAGGNATVGTINASGLYTAPAAPPAPATVTVSAVSVADATKSGSATVTITAAPVISVTVSPASATVLTAATRTFTATVSNAANTAVTWQVNGVAGGNATVGTISTGGVYTAPASVASTATVTVTAVSVADTTKSGSAAVTVPAVSVAVTPTSASVPAAATQQFTATVSNATNNAVTWRVNGAAGGNATVGTITTSGLYTAPAAPPAPATVTVSAVSAADTSKSGTASVTVTPAAGVAVTVAPRRAAITTGQTQQYTSSVTGTANTGVTWAVDGVSAGNASIGTISAAGLYTPPASGGSHVVSATSSAAPAQSATASVAVTDLGSIATQRYDNARTGQNLKEFALTPATLATAGAFGKLFSCAVDGVVYAQPLYVANLAIGGGVHNVVFVATEHDSVYAFDADASTCTQYWKMSFLSSGVTTVPASDTAETGDIPDEFGITGTPVIDVAGGALYVVANTKESGNYFYRLHALSLATGADLATPKVIQANVAGVDFVTIDHLQRPGLLLANNTVYVTFGSHGDTSIYFGWVLGYDNTSLAQTGAFCTSPHPSLSGHGGESAIWMSGAGPAADAAGNLYLSTGNGVFDATANTIPPTDPNNDFGDSVLKLSSALAVSDYFTPNNQATLNANDFDLGAGGVLVLPDAVGSTAHRSLAVIGDKESKLFLIDRGAMGRYASSGADGNVQTLAVNISTPGVFTGIFSTPSIWGSTLYIGATNDKVKAYTIGNAQIATTPSSTSSDTYAFPGSNTVISANGATGGVLWAIDTNKNGTNRSPPTGPFVLRAYDATNLATRLWSSDTNAADVGGNAAKFTVPTVANGKVYVAGQSQLTVYGLQP